MRTTRRSAAPAARLAVVCAALVGLAACSAPAESTPTSTNPPPTTTTAAPSPSTTAAPRTPNVVVPDGEVAGLPLVVVLHGFGGSGAQAREVSAVEAAANARGLRAVFAFPDGTGDDGFPRSWNAGGCCPFANLDGVDDVGFLATLITDLTREYALDARRVVVAGHSNGGMMAYRLACERPDLVRAVVVGAGALVAPSCTPSSAVTVLHLHGALDDVVPLAGGATSGITFPSAERSAGDYARAAGCEGASPAWSCPGGASVTLVVDPTWTHDWQPAWTERALDLLASLAPAG